MAEQQNSSQKILLGTIVAAVVLMAVVVPFSIRGDKSAAAGGADDADVRIQPVAKFELQRAAAPAAGGAPKDGATVVNTVCGACHNSGAAGAPKTGDKAAWGARIAQGNDALYKSAINGKGAMPARGGAASLSDAEVKAAVDYLVSKAK